MVFKSTAYKEFPFILLFLKLSSTRILFSTDENVWPRLSLKNSIGLLNLNFSLFRALMIELKTFIFLKFN